MEFVSPQVATLTRRFRVVRAADQLDVIVELYGVRISGNRVTARDREAYIRFVFGTQHVAERHFPTTADITTDSASHIAAGPSTLTVPLSGSTTLSFDALISRAEAVGVLGRTREGRPERRESALEIPAGLIISPLSETRMTARRTARTLAGVTEVWHARLQRPTGTRPVQLTAVRNLNTRDLVSRIPDAADRQDLVDNTTGGTRLDARRLWLSSHGVTGELRGDWPTAALVAYRHRMMTGRDLYVKTVRAGYLMPFGIPASIVAIAQREFDTDAGGGAVAAMRLRRYLVLDEGQVSIERTGVENKGRRIPFVSVTATLDESVLIRLEAIRDGGAIPGANDVVREDTRAPVMVSYTALDRDGGSVSFSLPAILLDREHAHNPSASAPAARLRTVMNGSGRIFQRTADLKGQSLAFATPEVSGSRSTARPTFAFEFEWRGPAAGVTTAANDAAASPAIHPAMKSATIVDNAVSAMTGSVPDPVSVSMHPRWITGGNASSNFDKAFLRLATPAVSAIGDGPVRGVVALDLRAEAINQTAGLGLDLPSASSLWDPVDALGAATRIIGGITLEDIVDAVVYSGAIPGVEIPGVKVEVEENTITTQVCFTPKIKSVESVGFLTTDDTKLSVIATSVLSVNDSVEPSFSTEVRIDDFTLRFLPGADNPLVDVHFNSVSAITSSSGSLVVKSDVSGVSLYGVLAYLSDLLGDAGFANPTLKVGTDSLDLGVSLKLPNISLGVMTIKGIRVGFDLAIPFTGGAGELAIEVGTRKNPVTVSLLSFGGTFFMGLTFPFGPDAGPSSIIVSASVFWELFKLDLILIKATVTLRVKATWQLVGDEVTFRGSVSLEGVIQFAGLVELSLTVKATLTYTSASEQMILKGTIVWDIDTALGGPDGTIKLGSTRIDLGSGGGRPAGFGRSVVPRSLETGDVSFGDLYSSTTWNEYCSAFAI
jgi:hypothetical protein